ncbi:hypothetical protein [uncultured Nostoc sp.]|uniref:hypothetical protein n=1 Tax=uncultured Nostoc sp. TaxID=340711 RepID=UPI0035CABF9D
MKNISFPNHWESPKYQLGQLVKQGRIIGVEYQAPGTTRAYDLSKGWIYSVLIDDLGYDTENVLESDIKPPSLEQLEAEIDYEKSLAEIHLENCSVLTKQLLEVEQP